MDWIKKLEQEAHQKRMCVEFYSELSKCEDKISAIELYLKNPTWAVRNDFPSLELLQSDFRHLEDEGVYVDYYFTGEVLDGRNDYVLHNCTGNLYVDFNLKKHIIPTIYVANGCDLVISANDSKHSISTTIPIKVFGENTVRVVSSDLIIPKISRL